MQSTRLGLLLVAMLAAADAAMRLTFTGRAMPEDSLWWLFDATREDSLPTWFSVVAMACVGLRCLQRARERRWWAVPGAGFCYLSLDDACMVHERLGAAAAPWLGAHGVYSWILLLAPVFVLGGGFVFAWLWRALGPDRGRRLHLLAGFAALGVALVIEAFEDKTIASGAMLRGLPFVEYTKWVEETLEMLGPVLLLGALRSERRDEPRAAPSA